MVDLMAFLAHFLRHLIYACVFAMFTHLVIFGSGAPNLSRLVVFRLADSFPNPVPTKYDGYGCYHRLWHTRSHH